MRLDANRDDAIADLNANAITSDVIRRGAVTAEKVVVNARPLAFRLPLPRSWR